ISDKAIIDDYHPNTSTLVSSSGGSVSFDVTNLTELNMQETTGTYSWVASDPANGMSRGVSSDNSRGAVFDWSGGGDSFYELAVTPALADFTPFTWLSFRACQQSHHPNTTAALEDLTFSVSLIDGNSASATVNIGSYGGGIEEVYQRSGGWQNEFEIVRIRLSDFLEIAPDLALEDITALRFSFGSAFGSAVGRIGLDDIELTNDEAILPGGAISLGLDGDFPDLVAPNAPFTVNVRIRGGEPLVPGSPMVMYRYAGGTYTAAPLTQIIGDLWQASLPAPLCADTPEVYFVAEGDVTGTVTLPATAPADVFTTTVGTMASVFDDDFESNLGWTVGAPGDAATTGIWTRVNPVGTDAQPEDDHTDPPGVTCFVTGQGVVGGGLGDQDIDGGQTTLTSPVIDVTPLGSEARIGYWRWYSNTTGAAPGEDIFVIDVSNGGAWVNVETVGPSGEGTSGGWIYHEFRIADFVTPNSTIQVRFVASDFGSGSVVEAALDDFVVFGVECE
ncbi:MAG: hypothetical protein KDA21_04595, partial [Phycisphaerales bacterium]|nr:hypothetical protein [Phycisphaerales bacterium]